MEWEIVEDEKIKEEWLKWGGVGDFAFWSEIIDRCERVAEKLNLKFTEFSDAKTFRWGFYYYERYYAYFKKKDSDDDELRAVVLEIVADNKISEVIEIRVATEKYIEEQLKH
jgi:hypothetical protein